jgi:YfiH family protein
MHPTRNRDLTSAPRAQATGAQRHRAGQSGLGHLAIAPWTDGHITHGFLGRRGGVSRGAFASLNLSYLAGDDPAHVETNWRRVKEHFPAAGFVQVHQVHGNRVHVVDARSRGVAAVADGMVTAARGVMLGILTADCVPVLLKDEAAGVAGALHAGWRGVIADIASAGVDAMVRLGARADRVQASLGPAIGACCFEVDLELARRFEAEIPGVRPHLHVGGPGKAFIDLKAILAEQLMRAGLARAAIVDVAVCTKCRHDRFFSRRAAGGATTGLQLSFVGLAE